MFVGGISYYTNEERLAEVFADCGEVKDIRMPLNEDESRVIFFCIGIILFRIVDLHI